MQINNNEKINSNNLDKIFTFVSVYVELKISEGLSWFLISIVYYISIDSLYY